MKPTIVMFAIFSIWVTHVIWQEWNNRSELQAQTSRSTLLYTFHREGSEAGSQGSCDFTVMKLADGTVVGTCFCQRGGNDGTKCGISVAK